MKTNNIILAFMIVSVFITGCTPEDAQNGNNTPPVITNFALEAPENASINTSIGFIEAMDPDGDKLRFSTNDPDYNINSTTGEVSLNKSNLFDYETSNAREFKVIVSDGQTSVEKMISISITNNNDGALTNKEKEFMDYFIYLAFAESPDHADFEGIRKWNNDIKVHTFGSKANPAFRNIVTTLTYLINPLIENQGISMEVTENPEEANLHIFRGNHSEIQEEWPYMHQYLEGHSDLAGLASTYKHPSGEIYEANIYVAPHLEHSHTSFSTLHELLHALGLGHSDRCEEYSTMASCYNESSFPDAFYKDDQGVLLNLYNPHIQIGDNKEAAKQHLETILSE